MQADQHYRAVNQEADGYHTRHINRRVTRRVEPEDHGGNRHQRHKEHPGCTAVSFEDFI